MKVWTVACIYNYDPCSSHGLDYGENEHKVFTDETLKNEYVKRAKETFEKALGDFHKTNCMAPPREHYDWWIDEREIVIETDVEDAIEDEFGDQEFYMEYMDTVKGNN